MCWTAGLTAQHYDSFTDISEKAYTAENPSRIEPVRGEEDLPSGQGKRVISSESSNTPFIPASMSGLLCFVGDKHLKPLNESINPDGGEGVNHMKKADFLKTDMSKNNANERFE